MEELKSKIEKLEKAINSESTPENFKNKMRDQLADLKQKLSEKEAEEAAKSDMKKDKAAPKKEEKKEEKAEPKKKAVKKIVVKASVKKAEPTKPKRAKEAEKKSSSKEPPLPSCDELLEKYKKQRANSKNAGKRYKKTSVSEKIGDNLASVASKVVHSVPLTEIKENPKVYIKKFERIEAYVSEFSNGLKSILGDDYDKEEIMSPLKDVISKFIAEVKKKYVK